MALLNDLFGDLEDDEEDENDEEGAEDMVDALVDETIFGLCLEIHRSCKIGTFLLDEIDMDSQKMYEIKEGKGIDVFGQVPMKKQYDCICPNCQRNLAASRFAPHLEKCMGMGRNSSRIASRRIANTGQRDNDNDSDYNDDIDWNVTPEKKSKKSKKDKSKKSKSKSKSGDIPSVGSTASDGSGSYESMSHDERKAILHQVCGVISEHTKKMCTRSVRCPQHTDDQRKAVRLFLLTQGSVLDDDVIDIDTYDDAENQVLRDSLQWEASSNPSPADSTSTVNSSSSKKRKASKHSSKSKKAAHSKSGSGHRDMSANLYEFV